MNKIFDYKCFIFDMDGVLIDSMTCWYQTGIDLLYQKTGVKLDINDPKVRSKAWKTIWSMEGFEATKFQEEWHEMMKKAYLEVPLKPYVIEFLNKAKELGIKLCIGTATPLDMATTVLKRLGIYDYFDIILDEASSGETKSTGKLFFDIIKLCNVSNEKTVIFEDNYHNLIPCKESGCFTIGVYDYISREKIDRIKPNCDLFIESFKDLLDE